MKFEVVQRSSKNEMSPVSVADFSDGFAAIEFGRLLAQADGVRDVAIYLRPETTLEVVDGGVIINEDE